MICRFRHHLLSLSTAASSLHRTPDYDPHGRELKFPNEHRPSCLRKFTQLFYLKNSSPDSIKRYNDLYGLRIGVLNARACSGRFDNDAWRNR